MLEHTDHDGADEQKRSEQNSSVQTRGHIHGGPPVIGLAEINLSCESPGAEAKRGQIHAASQHNGALQNHREGISVVWDRYVITRACLENENLYMNTDFLLLRFQNLPPSLRDHKLKTVRPMGQGKGQ